MAGNLGNVALDPNRLAFEKLESRFTMLMSHLQIVIQSRTSVDIFGDVFSLEKPEYCLAAWMSKFSQVDYLVLEMEVSNHWKGCLNLHLGSIAVHHCHQVAIGFSIFALFYQRFHSATGRVNWT